jgi:nucleoside 2-deoxyribosyltransferase
MIKLYLAHNFESRKAIRKWQLKIEGKYNIILDNPFYNNPERAKDMEVIDSFKDGSIEQKRYMATRSDESIVEDDLDKIRKSDGILAIAESTRIGTPMEIFFGSRILRIPVYVVTRRYARHPWITRHATVILGSTAQFERFAEKTFGRKK